MFMPVAAPPSASSAKCATLGMSVALAPPSSSSLKGKDRPEAASRTNGAKDPTLAAIDRCLDEPWEAKRSVSSYFTAHADGVDDAGHPAVSLQQFVSIMPGILQELGLPADFFDGMENQHGRFDFNGDGMLDEGEAKRMFKKLLLAKRIELVGPPEIKVPWTTMQAAGYTVEKELGRGGQGAMYLCSKTNQRQKFCVKFYDKNDANAGGLESLVDEFRLMKDLQDEHCARTYECFQDRGFYYLVNEPYFGGDLTKLGKNAFDNHVNMSEDWWRGIFRQCLEGLDYLHYNAIMHCDLKEPNIMIARKDSFIRPRPVLIDFGLASSFANNELHFCGTPGYIPPETWETEVWYPRGDVFSMGIVFFQLMCGLVPSKNGTVLGALVPPDADMESIKRSTLDMSLPWQMFPDTMPDLQNLVQAMTARDRTHRPRTPQALAHQWFSSLADAPLPHASLDGLVGAAANQCVREELVAELAAIRLHALRELQRTFQGQDRSGEGKMSPQVLLNILEAYGLDGDVASRYADISSFQEGQSDYAGLMVEAIEARTQFDEQLVKDAFDQFDIDQSGTLDTKEIRSLIEHIFDVPQDEDVLSDLVRQIDRDKDGYVSFEEFKDAALQYGHLGQRMQCKLFGPMGKASLGRAPAKQGVPNMSGAVMPDCPQTVSVGIWSARQLAGGSYGTYGSVSCICRVPSRMPLGFRTRPVAASREPAWNYEEDIVDIEPGDSLEFILVDASSTRDSVIGNAMLVWSQFFPAGFDGELHLFSKNGGRIQGLLHVAVSADGCGPLRAPRAPTLQRREDAWPRAVGSAIPTRVSQSVTPGGTGKMAMRTFLANEENGHPTTAASVRPGSTTTAKTPLPWMSSAKPTSKATVSASRQRGSSAVLQSTRATVSQVTFGARQYEAGYPVQAPRVVQTTTSASVQRQSVRPADTGLKAVGAAQSVGAIGARGRVSSRVYQSVR